MPEDILMASLCRHIGKTVTIFTTSGGLSGSGFTGTLAGVGSDGVVRLITGIGAAPACPVGSACTGPIGFGGGCGFGSGTGSLGFNNPLGSWLGSITQIPLNRIASFTHNAISSA